MKTRNFVAQHAWKFNKAKTVPAKKGKGAVFQRRKVNLNELLSN